MRLNFLILQKPQRGSMLLMSIFAIMVLGGLGIALMKISASQQSITTREVLGTRAWFAVQSGSEWAMTQLFPLATDLANLPQTNCDFANPNPIEITFKDNNKGLKGCKVFVKCNVFGEAPLLQYRIESTGTCGTREYEVVRVHELWAKGI